MGEWRYSSSMKHYDMKSYGGVEIQLLYEVVWGSGDTAPS
jgi:hypothetical protein